MHMLNLNHFDLSGGYSANFTFHPTHVISTSRLLQHRQKSYGCLHMRRWQMDDGAQVLMVT